MIKAAIKDLITNTKFTGITINLGFIGLNFAGDCSKKNICPPDEGYWDYIPPSAQNTHQVLTRNHTPAHYSTKLLPLPSSTTEPDSQISFFSHSSAVLHAFPFSCKYLKSSSFILVSLETYSCTSLYILKFPNNSLSMFSLLSVGCIFYLESKNAECKK